MPDTEHIGPVIVLIILLPRCCASLALQEGIRPADDLTEPCARRTGGVAMNYIDAEMFAYQLSFDLEEMDFDELNLVGDQVCSRCGAEFDAAEELENIGKHGVCQSCLSELKLEAAEGTMDP
jgi:hypothetical protein